MTSRTQPSEPAQQPHRAGFACFVGRPNAGKSTLTNALVGKKVAITSTRPQTTRHTVRGIVHRPDAQLVLVDTPGLHKPRTLLGERLNDVVRTTWAEVDVIGFCLPADQRLGPGDRFIAKELAGIRKTPKVAIVTKTDLVDPETLAQQLIAVDQLGRELGIEWAEIIPVSAVDAVPDGASGEPVAVATARRTGATADTGPGGTPPGTGGPGPETAVGTGTDPGTAPAAAAQAGPTTRAPRRSGGQVDLLADLLVPLLPESPALYPEGDLTDEPEQVMVAELIREAALEGVRDELPHSIAVVVEEMLPRPDRPADRPLLDIHANVYIERPSQKGIVIGPKGKRLKDVGVKSRRQIEALLGTPVFLDLHVKVAKDWQRDPKQLRRLGF
ncbi:GTPase Era [Streptomyces sulfonofaciens]|nr:GTPase Era [Streptomyces sulfonofaciens]